MCVCVCPEQVTSFFFASSSTVYRLVLSFKLDDTCLPACCVRACVCIYTSAHSRNRFFFTSVVSYVSRTHAHTIMPERYDFEWRVQTRDWTVTFTLHSDLLETVAAATATFSSLSVLLIISSSLFDNKSKWFCETAVSLFLFAKRNNERWLSVYTRQ